MKDIELKQLKDSLWHSADVLRAGAHLAANKYGQPILGLIFLRYADILFKQHKDEIEAEYNKYKGGRMEKTIKEIAIEKCGFFLPECAYYDYINEAPDDANKAIIVKKAMEAIEDENPKMLGVLPKEVYAQLVPEEEPELLSNIVRIFKDIPENCTVDIFGEIYEYFLGNFALAEGKDGGTFYTPATVVRYMVEVLNPEPGDKKFLESKTQNLIQINDCPLRGVAQALGVSVLQTGAFLYIGDVVMATITKKQMEEYERLRRDRDNGRLLTPDGLRLICAAYENDPEKIGIHMLEMLAKFRNEGIID